ncbi:MAG: YbhN family protein [Chloroflexia bacterium]
MNAGDGRQTPTPDAEHSTAGKAQNGATSLIPRIKIPLPVKIAASVLLLAFVLLKVDLTAFLRVVAGANLALILLAAAVAFGAYLINTFKWQVLLSGSGAHVPYWDLLWLNFIGIFYNVVLPGQVGGEVIKGVRLSRAGVAGGIAAISVVADRVTGLLALLVLGVGGAILSPSVTSGRTDLVLWVVGLTLVLGAATVVLVTGRGVAPVVAAGKALRLPGGNVLSRIGAPFEQLPRGSRGLSSLWLPMLLALAFQLCIVYSNLLICMALGIPVTYLSLLWVVAVVSFLQSLPISLAGIGVREGAFVYLLGLQGIAAPSALALSLIVFAIQIAMAIVGGLLQLLDLRGRKA